MQPLVRKNVGSSFPYPHPRKMLSRWQQMATDIDTDTDKYKQTLQQLGSTSHHVHLLYQQHKKKHKHRCRRPNSITGTQA